MTDWDFIRALIADEGPATAKLGLWGPPGIGKSYSFITASAREPVKMTMAGDMLSSDFYGAKMPAGDGKGGTIMTWQDGPALIAARANAPLLLNELDKAAESVKDVLYAIADDPESRRLSYVDGTDGTEVREFVPAPTWRIFATSNFAPHTLPDALADRFLWLEVTEPAPEALALLPVHMHDACRVLAGHPDPVVRVSFRSFRRYAGLQQQGYPAPAAARACFGDRWEAFCDADALAALIDQAQGMGGEL